MKYCNTEDYDIVKESYGRLPKYGTFSLDRGMTRGDYNFMPWLESCRLQGIYFQNAYVVQLQNLATASIFNELAKKWKKETRGMSTTIHMTMNDNYLDIMAMGPAVIPFILMELKQHPDHWFVALRHLTKSDPVVEEDRGDLMKMTKAWLDWGHREGLV